MARARTVTKLPLAEWAEWFGLNPLHFEGVQLTELQAVSGTCSVPWMQYDWQANDRVSREQLARVIARAEAMLEDYLGYHLLPDWDTDERVATIPPHRPETIMFNPATYRGGAAAVRPRWGHVISGGARLKTLVQAGAAITWSDAEEPDTYKDTGTVTVTVPAGTVGCELRAYFPGNSGSDDWELRPITASVSGTTATIRFRRELAVSPALQQGVTPGANQTDWPVADGYADADFVATLDVYRITNDPTQQGSALWEPIVGGCTCAVVDSCSMCTYATQSICVLPHGAPRAGWLGYQPGTYDPATGNITSNFWTVARQPDILRLYYRSGFRAESKACPDRQMDDTLKAWVCKLSASMLDREPCGCNREYFGYLTEDMSFQSGGEQISRYRIAQVDLESPFGTRRGALEVWHDIKMRPTARVMTGAVSVV